MSFAFGIPWEKHTMGSTNTKEEVIVAQPGAGNSATAKTGAHLEIWELILIMLGVIFCVVIFCVCCYCCGKGATWKFRTAVRKEIAKSDTKAISEV